MTQSVALSPASTWHGKLNLVYAQRQNSTQLIYSQNQAPLKVQRPFYPEGEGVCHSVILHTAGGVVGGDELSYDVRLENNSQALITTAAAGKIYRSNCLQARQNIKIQINDGACLEWLPQETIVFDGANYRQDLRVDLAANACFVGWDILRFGRSARGEKFLQGEWRGNTSIWQEGKPLWIDRQYLPGCETIFYSPHGLFGKPIVGSFVWVGCNVSSDFVAKARNLLQCEGEYGVSRLERGFLCRYRGFSTTEVRNLFVSIWGLLRMSLLSRDVCLPRVWQI